jgi:hypothetical protein
MEIFEFISSTTDQEEQSYIKFGVLLKKSFGVYFIKAKSLGKTRALSMRNVERWTSDFRNWLTI